MRSRDLIDGFDYGEYMQRQMFCFGSDDGGGGGGSTADDDMEAFEGAAMSSYESDYGGRAGGGGNDGANFYTDPQVAAVYPDAISAITGFTPAELAAGEAARAAINAANKALLDAASQKPKVAQVSDYGMPSTAEDLAQRVAQSYIDYAPIMGPELYSAGNVGGSLLDFFKTGSTGSVPIRSNYFDDPTTLSAFKDIALGQIPGRMEKAGALPGLLGAAGTFTLGRMQKALEAGGRPVFDAKGQLKGVFSEGPFGFGEVYTGMPVEGVEGTGYDAGGRDGGGQETVKPVDPVTGQCDEGYIFDEDLQACRLDTRSGRETAPIAPPTPPAAPGTYARLGLLDVAPTGVSDFATRYGLGPQDFGAANLAYRRGAGTQFDIYKDPYQREGFTLLG